MNASHKHSSAIRIALETRVMFDGAAIATADPVVNATTPATDTIQAPDLSYTVGTPGATTTEPAHSEGAGLAHDGSGDADAAQASGDLNTSPAADKDFTAQNTVEIINALTATAPPEGSTRHEIYFIDSSLPDQDVLRNALPINAHIVYLDNARDGLTQLVEALEGRNGLDAIHIVTHASEGLLQVGGTQLDTDTIRHQYADLLAQIGLRLNANADVLLYGCNLAAGDTGMATLNALAQAMTSDIAASTNITGQGGDWVLEAHVGTIETSSLSASDWNHNLLTVGNDSYIVNQNAGPTSLNVLSNDIFLLSTPKISSFTQPAHGALTLNASGDALIYKPTTGYTGTDSFTYTVKDSALISATGTVTITVNAAPVIVAPNVAGLTEDAPVTFSSALGTQLRVTDDGTTGTVTLSVPNGTLALNTNIVAGLLSGLLTGTSQTGNGTGIVTLNGQLSVINDALNGLVYTPSADANGPINLTVTANDGTASTVTSIIPMNLAAVADITPDTVTAYLDTPSSFNVLANDSFESAGRFVSAFTQPLNGTVTVDAQGNAVYTPRSGWTGADSFTYTVTSGGVTETANVTVTTTVPNYAPTLTTPASQTLAEDGLHVFSIANGNAISVADGNNDNLSVTLNASRGTLLLAQTAGLPVTGNGTGSVTLTGTPASLNDALNGLAFTPTADYYGAASITVSASDGIAATQSSVVTMTITPVTDGVADSLSTGPLQTVSFYPLANDTFDATPSITDYTQAAHGTVTLRLGGQMNYTPALGYTGPDTFTYTVTSGGVNEVVSVNVTVGNQAPTTSGTLTNVATLDGAIVVGVPTALVFRDADLLDVLRFSASNLPAGLAIDPLTGTIAGIVDAHASQVNGGVYTVTVTATDLSGASVSTTLGITVSNPSPIAGLNIAVTAHEDTPLVIPRDTLAIIDPDGDAVTVTGATALHGVVSIGNDGSLIYTPHANYNGVDVITYIARDADGGTATGDVAVTVLPVLDLPTIKLPTIPVFYEDTPLIFAEILGQKLEIGDIDGNLLELTLNTPVGSLSLSQPSNVTVVANANGTLQLQGSATDINAALELLVYTPGADYNGPVQLSLQLGQLSGALGSTLNLASLVTASLPISIETVADVVNDHVEVTAGTPTNFNVLANDTFENAGRLVVAHSEPANGTVVIDADGNAQYTPGAGFTGTDSFTYTVESNGTYETGTVTVTVALPNYAPSVSAPAILTVIEDTPLAFADTNAIHVEDLNGDHLTVTLLVNHGTLTLGQTTGLSISTGDGAADALMVFSGSAADINAALAGMTFTPTADYNGSASLNVQVSDGVAPVQSTSVLLAITPVADGVADTFATGPLASYSFYPLANDHFEDANAAITSVSAAAHGTVVLGLNGEVTYTPSPGYVGADSFTYTVTSGGVTETVTVSVAIGNQAPTTTGNLGRLDIKDADVVLAVSTAQAFNEADAFDTLRFSATGLPAGLSIDPATGVISGAVDGHASVNGLNGSGQYSVVVTATDRAGAFVSTTMVINASNPAPVTEPTLVVGNEDTSIAISTAQLNVQDPDGDTITLTGATAANGSVTFNANGSLTYTPNPNYNGTDTITYSVRDVDGGTSTGTIVVSVLPVTDLPTITLPSVPAFAEDTPLVFGDLPGQQFAVGDVDGEVLVLKLSVPLGSFTLTKSVGLTVTENTGGVLRLEGSAADINAALAGLIYLPGADYNGPLNMTVQLGQLVSGVLNVSTVLPIEIIPVADIVEDLVAVGQDTPTGFNVLANDAFENAAAVVTAVGDVTAQGDGSFLTTNGATLTFNANGQMIYTPASGFTGTDSFTYTVTANGTTETATVTLTVTEPNHVPTLIAPAAIAGSEDSPIVLSGASAITVGDANAGDTLTVTLSVTHGGLTLANTSGLTILSSGNNAATLTVSGSADALNAALNGLTFTPVADYNGTALLQVQVSDGIAAPVNASVALTIAAVADGVADRVITEPLVPVTFSPLANDTFANSDATVTAVTQGTSGTATIGANNTLVYTPDVGFRGIDSFTYTVTSGGVTETVNVTVTVGTNQAPVASGLLPVTTQDSAEVLVTAAPAFADSDLYDGLSYSAANLPAGLSIDPVTGVISGTLGSSASVGGDNGTYSVVVTATDLAGATASSTLLIQVSNPGPVAGATVAVGVEDTALTIPFADLAISDPDGDGVTVVEAVATNGSVTIGADGSLTYTPVANFNGVDTITFNVRDADGATANGTVAINVAPAVDLPTLQVPSIPVFAEDTALVFADLLGQQLAVGDVDGKVLDLTLNAPVGSFTFSQTSNVTIVSNADGALHLQGSAADINAALNALVYTPGSDYNGTLQISLQLNQLVGGIGSAIDGTTLVSSALPLTIAPVADIVGDHVSIVGDMPVVLNVLTNDSFENESRLVTSMNGVAIDASGNGSFISVNGGTVTFNASGALVYTPRAGFIGDDSFAYTVASNGTTETATVTMTVNPVPNVDPVAEPIADQTARDGQVIVLDIVQAAFSDTDGDALAFSVSGLPAGLAIDPETGVISGTLDGQASTLAAGGIYSVTVTARDGHGGEVSQTFTLSVSNPGPDAVADSFSVERNTVVNGSHMLTGNVLLNDSDPDGDALSVQVTPVQGPAHGALALRSDGSFTYTPVLNYSGTDSFSYRVVDEDGGSSVALVTININAANEAPLAHGSIDPQSGTDNVPFTLSTADRFTDIDGDVLIYSATGLPAGLSIDAATGLITGTVDRHASVNGIDRTGIYSVTVTADDGQGGTANQPFTLTITNPAPVTSDGQLISTLEDTAYEGRLVATDADNDALTFTVIQLPAQGTLLLNGDGTYTYTPEADYTGPDSFSYRVTDTDGGTAVATVSIYVTPLNDAPIAVGTITDQSATDGASFALDAAGYFTDVDNAQLVFSSSPLPSGLFIDPLTGLISGTLGSSAAASGPYTITVFASDGVGAASQSFVLTVTNPSPVTSDSSYSIAEDAVLTGTLTATDTDGDAFTFTVVQQPAHGSLILNADGTFVYQPFADYNGPDFFTYTVTDADGASVSATVNLTVTAVNDEPEAVGTIAPQISTDGSGFSLDVSGNFQDADSHALRYSADGLPGGLTINAATGVISGTLNGNASTQVTGGAYTVVITATDPGNTSITSTFAFVVTNPAPIANDAHFTLSEDHALTDRLIATDPDSDALTFSTTIAPLHGTLELSENGTFTYTPDAQYSGTDGFTYQVRDADGGISLATATLTVTAMNDAPVANGTLAAQTGVDGQPFNLPVGGNFQDPDGDTLTYTVDTLPAGLTLIDGVISGTLDPHASVNGEQGTGLYTITVTATDASGASATQTFTLNVSNPSPVTPGASITVLEDNSFSGQLTAVDPDGDTLAFGLASNGGPVHGTLVLNADGPYTYTPDANYNGTDRFSYTVTDNDGGITTASVNITVASGNDAPTATGSIAPQSGLDGASFSLDLLDYFADADTDTLSYAASGLPAGLSIIDGVITGTLDSRASFGAAGGVYNVTVTATDPGGASAELTFTLTVGNPAPTTADIGYTVSEDTRLIGTLVASDPDQDALTFSASVQPLHGTLTLNANGSFTYVPAPNYTGTDSFTYQVVDSDGGISTATVTVVVNPANDAPVVTTPIPAQRGTDGSRFTLDVAGNFRDIDGDQLTYAANGLPAGLAINPDTGLIAGTFGSGSSAGGPYSVTITATDTHGTAVSQTFLIDVSNPLPTTSDSSFTVSLDGRYTGILQASDADGDALSFGLVQGAGPSHGVLTLNVNGSFVYAPINGYSGTDSFSYSVQDADGGVVTATVSITINGSPVINNGPIVSQPIAAQRADDGASYRLEVGAAFGDADGDRLTYSASNLPAGLSIDPSTGVISGTVDSRASQGGVRGVYDVTITATDGQQSIGQVVTFSIANPPPQTAGDNYGLNENRVLTGTLQATDPDGDALTFSLAADGGPTHGTLVLNPDGTFVYRPDANYNGTDRFTYVVRDADGGLTEATITLSVAAVNDAPVAGPSRFTTEESTPVTVDVLANATDAEGDTLTVVDARSDNGTVVIDAGGTLTYTPQPGFTGVDTITYVISDGTTPVTANATVTVRPLDVTPTVPDSRAVRATAEALQTQPGTPPSRDDNGVGQYLRTASYKLVLLDAINGVKRLDGMAAIFTNTPMLNVADAMQSLGNGQEIRQADAPIARAIGDLQEVNRQPLDTDQLVPIVERTPVNGFSVVAGPTDTDATREPLEDAAQTATGTSAFDQAQAQQSARGPLTLQEQLLEASRKREADQETLARLLRG